MSWTRRAVGLDGVDLLIHAGVTFSVMAIGSTLWSHEAAEIMLATVSLVSLLVLGLRRHRAVRNLPPETTDEIAAERIAKPAQASARRKHDAHPVPQPGHGMGKRVQTSLRFGLIR